MADRKKQNKRTVKLPANFDPYDIKLKKQLDPKADEKNYIRLQSGKPMLCCGSKRRADNSQFCGQKAGMGTDHTGYGRCKYHGGSAKGPTTKKGKERSAVNARKHGFYSKALAPKEREAYEQLLDSQAITLEHEIYMLKAKVLLYLQKWQGDWDAYYNQKLAELTIKHKCRDCYRETLRSSLEQELRRCPKCHGKQRPKEVDRYPANRTAADATLYADNQTRVFFSEGENGARSFYHAGTVEDRALDRTLNTLGRLVEKHAKLTSNDGENMLNQINGELRAASQGNVSLSWNTGPAQQRKDGGD